MPDDQRGAGLDTANLSLASTNTSVLTIESVDAAGTGSVDASVAADGGSATANLTGLDATAGESSPRVLYYFFEFTAGSDTFIGEAIETAGGDNVAGDAGISGFRKINDEVVATSDPNWIVTPEGASIPDREPFTSTAAVRANRTLTIDDNYISQPAPRVVIPMQRMARAFEDTRPSTDPDGDGIYEDINGDGEVTAGDATVLFNAAFEGDAAIVGAPAMYDINRDGEVTAGDATVLFQESL